ncbi:hypothetical protein AcW2_000227 [Taiwanofungus camphoratus]|nr:hypothetical protein AcW2_000227 [Antrodia cinnamomea]
MLPAFRSSDRACKPRAPVHTQTRGHVAASQIGGRVRGLYRIEGIVRLCLLHVHFGLAQRGKAGAETVRRGVVASVPRRVLRCGTAVEGETCTALRGNARRTDVCVVDVVAIMRGRT